MKQDPGVIEHQRWIGYVQPVGLLVSTPALVAAQAYPEPNPAPLQKRFLEHVREVKLPDREEAEPVVADLARLLVDVFGWRETDLRGGPNADALPADLEVVLEEYHETLRPTFAVPNPDAKTQKMTGAPAWLLLVQETARGADLDAPAADEQTGWDAGPQTRFERLLRETGVPIGLLSNGTHLRIVYAPRGENSGYATFPVAAMAEVAGRPILAALAMLLGEERLFSLPEKQRLPAILASSRKYQGQVSNELADQVLAALYELLRGFQAADERTNGRLLRQVLADDPESVYRGLITVLLRMIFVLYAEHRGLLPTHPVFVKHYSVSGLFDRLRADAGLYPDTMDQRFGAWAQLLSLFRLVHDGGGHGDLRLPARQGHLFSPTRFPFLEGRSSDDDAGIPLVSDGVVYRVLENLLILDGERLSYRTLDVEQIGSVYEALMGFRLERTKGRSLAVKSPKARGASFVLDLDALLALAKGERAKEFQKQTGQALKADVLTKAKTPEEVEAAIEKKIDRAATPAILPPGALILQPSDERRKSGSHYTPRSLTEPIVREALRPVIEDLGEKPTAEAILGLRVLDPAMGSGAFLVEACRQLGAVLVKAWRTHGTLPRLPLDEDELLHAQRLIAQQCLCGVDRNPMAVDLAKMSLWLATLAKEHSFTFLDHALRHGDSLVGLSKAQITAFHWDLSEAGASTSIIEPQIRSRLAKVKAIRAKIRSAPDGSPEPEMTAMLAEADEALADTRLIGHLVVTAFFRGKSEKEREAERKRLYKETLAWLDGTKGAKRPDRPAETRPGPGSIAPFHWEIEFPEVFDRENPGFDVIVGNPPFAGKNTISNTLAPGYGSYLLALYEGTNGKSDLVGFFFRRAFDLIREGGTCGLIATNTIAQGDTRAAGLRWICTHGGAIYRALRRLKWPGEASVVVSQVHLRRGTISPPFRLDGREVDRITAFLLDKGGDEDPARLPASGNQSFHGADISGKGFVFTDDDLESTPIEVMHRIMKKRPKSSECLFPFIGGKEINESPTLEPIRYVIGFGKRTEEECRRQWPELLAIVEEKVRPDRASRPRNAQAEYLSGKWWQWHTERPTLQAAIKNLDRVLVNCQVSNNIAFSFQPKGRIFAHTLNVYALAPWGAFAVLQTRPHEKWVRTFCSTLGEGVRYTIEDCFETFPFPEGFKTSPALEAAGKEYYDFRAALMVKNSEGLTSTYNRFHDPEEASAEIKRLRELHDAMDRAVLDAYGWKDIKPKCEFLLDYEEEEEEGETSRRKKPWRWRWPDEIQDEVLARLLALNRERAEAEKKAAASSASGAPGAGKAKKAGRKKTVDASTPTLFKWDE